MRIIGQGLYSDQYLLSEEAADPPRMVRILDLGRGELSDPMLFQGVLAHGWWTELPGQPERATRAAGAGG